jgi:hypothetical protein
LAQDETNDFQAVLAAALAEKEFDADARAADGSERFVDEKFVADLLSVSTGYLANLRYKGGGPKYYNLGKLGRGRCIRYRLADILAWTESRAVSSTSEYVRGT